MSQIKWHQNAKRCNYDIRYQNLTAYSSNSNFTCQLCDINNASMTQIHSRLEYDVWRFDKMTRISRHWFHCGADDGSRSMRCWLSESDIANGNTSFYYSIFLPRDALNAIAGYAADSFVSPSMCLSDVFIVVLKTSHFVQHLAASSTLFSHTKHHTSRRHSDGIARLQWRC